MKEFDRLPWELEKALSGEAFRRRRRLVLPLLTTDPEGFPRAALLTPGEVRANSPTQLTVAVGATSRTAVNLIRRRKATLLYMHRSVTASVEARAGRGHVCARDPDRHLFPLTVARVRIDRPAAKEGNVALLTGPTFTGSQAARLFSPELFEELGTVRE
ncbi:MAG TPA: hypothetical protein VMR54_06850 [Thermoanaerobaculia bacterium]|nr:hypothetical protein [Thermoanaerobaculia bacterium]